MTHEFLRFLHRADQASFWTRNLNRILHLTVNSVSGARQVLHSELDMQYIETLPKAGDPYPRGRLDIPIPELLVHCMFSQMYCSTLP